MLPGAPVTPVRGTKGEDLPVAASALYMNAGIAAGIESVEYKTLGGAKHCHLIEPRGKARDVLRQAVSRLLEQYCSCMRAK